MLSYSFGSIFIQGSDLTDLITVGFVENVIADDSRVVRKSLCATTMVNALGSGVRDPAKLHQKCFQGLNDHCI